MDEHDAFILQPNTSAQNKYLLPIANEKNELNLLSSILWDILTLKLCVL